MCDWLLLCLVIGAGRLGRDEVAGCSGEAMLDSAIGCCEEGKASNTSLGRWCCSSSAEVGTRAGAASELAALTAGSPCTARAQWLLLVACAWYSVCHVGPMRLLEVLHGRPIHEGAAVAAFGPR